MWQECSSTSACKRLLLLLLKHKCYKSMLLAHWGKKTKNQTKNIHSLFAFNTMEHLKAQLYRKKTPFPRKCHVSLFWAELIVPKFCHTSSQTKKKRPISKISLYAILRQHEMTLPGTSADHTTVSPKIQRWNRWLKPPNDQIYVSTCFLSFTFGQI